MKITQVQTIPIGNMRLVRIATDEGITGLGEIAYDCHSAVVAFAIRQMSLVGLDPLRIEAFWDTMYHGTFWRGGPIWTSAISGVEHALWDIKAKHLGVPVNHLVGGPLRDRVKVYTHFGGNSPEACAESALQVVEMGFQAIKTDPFRSSDGTLDAAGMRDAVERIRATREAVGDDVDILIECHGFLNPATAIRVGQMLEEFSPFFYEESAPPENVDEMAKVAAAVNIPIATGERLYTRYDFRQILENQIADYIQPDLCHCGGFNEGRKIAALAETYHVRVLPHNPNGPISTLVGVHFGACTANFEMLEMLRPDHRPDQSAIFPNLPTPKDGYIDVPTEPGWGAEVNEEALSAYPPDA
ncbi:MAG: galactonate dehydratase [Candidatus Poribacteria bacterium]|nr:galactonate dehydratase [Candidatus Poribacteria bacterium]